MRILVFLFFLAGIFSQAGAKPLQIASLSTVLSDMSREIGGEEVEIIEIVRPGMDPHHFEPTPGDMQKMSDADLVLASGLGFESFLERLEKSLGSNRVFVAGNYIRRPLMVDEHSLTCDHSHSHDHGHSHHSHSHHDSGMIADPHWWHSVENTKAVATALRNTLTSLRPEERKVFEANTKNYQKRLDELAKWIRLQVAPVPRRERVLVTSHAALGYFARDYGFTILPVQGISTADQPSSKKVRDLIDTIKQGNVRVVFAENIENPRVLQEITRETGATLGGVLYADGLGTGEAATYEGMMRHNTRTIVSALKN